MNTRVLLFLGPTLHVIQCSLIQYCHLFQFDSLGYTTLNSYTWNRHTFPLLSALSIHKLEEETSLLPYVHTYILTRQSRVHHKQPISIIDLVSPHISSAHTLIIYPYLSRSSHHPSRCILNNHPDDWTPPPPLQHRSEAPTRPVVLGTRDCCLCQPTNLPASHLQQRNVFPVLVTRGEEATETY